MKPDSRETFGRLLALKFVISHGLANPFAEVWGSWSSRERKQFNKQAGAQAEAVAAVMEENGVWPFLSPDEKQFLSYYGTDIPDSAHAGAIWRLECAAMLLWALGLDAWPDIDARTTPETLKKIPWNLEPLPDGLALRPEAEIEQRRALMEFWHWRVRTQFLIEEGETFEPTEEMKREGLISFDAIVRRSVLAAFERGDVARIVDEDLVFAEKPFRNLSGDELMMARSIILERHHALNWLCGQAPGNEWDKTPTET